MLARFSLKTVWLDLYRSMRIYGTSKSDVAAKVLLFGLPTALGVASFCLAWRLAEPTALLPAVSLLAGVLFASAGQLISLRARIADSVLLAGNSRVRSIFRESLSGSLLAAVAALVSAVLLGAIAVLPVQPANRKAPFGPMEYSAPLIAQLLTAAFTLFATFVVLMFVSSARRLYQAFLEAFEGGRPLEKPKPKPASDSHLLAVERDEVDEPDGFANFEFPASSKNYGSAP